MLGFNHIAWPMNQLTKGGGDIVLKWTTTQEHDFEKLKNHLCTTPVLMLPNLHYPFEIETNASDYSTGAMITQVGHQMEFHLKTFNAIVCKHSSYERELYAIV